MYPQTVAFGRFVKIVVFLEYTNRPPARALQYTNNVDITLKPIAIRTVFVHEIADATVKNMAGKLQQSDRFTQKKQRLRKHSLSRSYGHFVAYLHIQQDNNPKEQYLCYIDEKVNGVFRVLDDREC